MTTFFTSDLHFGHQAIIKFCSRPFADTDEMDAHLINAWNTTVDKFDHVYVLGDVSFRGKARTLEIIRQLHGIKFLIYGNHDDMNLAIEQEFQDSWDLVVKSLYGSGGTRHHMTMCHYPLRVWDRAHYGSWNLHGHSHNTLAPMGKQLDVGVDSAASILGDYRPFHIDEVASILTERTYEQQDHHNRASTYSE